MTSTRAPSKRHPTQASEAGLLRTPFGVAGSDLECVTTDAGDLWIPVDDEVIRQYMRNTGTWESDVGKAILGCMPDNGGIFLDVGAHVGYFSCLVAHAFPTCVVHAFEPNPRIYDILTLNAWQASERITTWPFALQGQRGLLSMTEALHNTGDTRGTRTRDGTIATIVAPAMDLDGLLPGLQPDVVKIDVQGAELDVIQGMAGIIHQSNRIKVIMEYSPALLEERSIDPRSALGMLRGYDFNIALINGPELFDAVDSEIIAFTESAGPDSHTNIMLYKK